MKRLVYILAIAALLLPSCKKESWADWRVENEIWLKNMSAQPGVKTTPTGLCYKIVSQPSQSTGRHPDALKSVSITYTGSLITGYIFDSSSTTLAVSNLIKGFAEGLKKMVPGDHYILYIPYDLGYGEEGTGTEGGSGYIPPYSTLIFEVTLHNVY